ncbi:MAG TPA: hypothetical protein VIH04_06510 [Nitrosarchaeum sp.]
MDFKYEMQERIDNGMNPDQAYNETRDSYAEIWDNRDKFAAPCCGPNGCSDMISVCDCTCDTDCECKTPVEDE